MKLLTRMPASFFPFYQQEGMNECGHACIKMIAKYYGLDYNPSEIERRKSVTAKGVNMLHLSNIITAIGLISEALKGTFEEFMEQGELPCIAFWEQNHFIVVFDASEQYIQIADPKVGKHTLTHQEFIDGWTTMKNGQKEGVILTVRSTD
ncbi:MAG: cysteine peptidase family C39 domain-containing protein [Saprospiraceae bacterium]|nr:cysteine peptidase family C39 domain-containing protein [Saprospiraceae bacterium]